MSKNEWERGTLKIPTAAYTGLKEKVRDAYNAWRLNVYGLAVRIHAKYPTHPPAEDSSATWQFRNTVMGDPVFAHEKFLVQAFEACRPWILNDPAEPRARRIQQWRKPTKEALGLATTRTTEFRLGEASITFNNDTHEVTWSVGENNHAVERAREEPVAKAFFSALANVKWTRGSGGELVGNDEYNRDAVYAGGGGNYVTTRFGPLGGAMQEDIVVQKLALSRRSPFSRF